MAKTQLESGSSRQEESPGLDRPRSIHIIPMMRNQRESPHRKRPRRSRNVASSIPSSRLCQPSAACSRRIGLMSLLVLLFHTQTNAFVWTSHPHKNRCTRRSVTASSSSSFPPPRDGNSISSTRMSNNLQGLSKFHRSILSRTADTQRFVTGKYPVVVEIRDNPTKKWLHQLGRRRFDTAPALTELLVNGTAPSRSLASTDRFQWLDEDEQKELWHTHSMVSCELLAEIHTERPGYLHVLKAHGAGSTAAVVRKVAEQGGYLKWKRAATATDVVHTEEEHAGDGARNKDRLWVTGFSLAGRQGLLKSVDATVAAEEQADRIQSVNSRTAQAMLWPNEVHPVPASLWQQASVATKGETAPSSYHGNKNKREEYQDALLVSDGFLVPGKDRGGIYVVRNPGSPSEWTVSLTADPASTNDRWFYHRAVWVDLTGDGRQSLLTARAKVSTRLSSGYSNKDEANAGVTTGITKSGELLWLEMPKPHRTDPHTGTPLESDGTVFDPFSARHLPWKTHVLDKGPDVMFSVVDLDPEDDTVEVISSQFFGKQVALHSIRKGPQPQVEFERIIDDRCGSAFGCILTDLDGRGNDVQGGPHVIDSGSTVGSPGPGDSCSHLLVTSHECSYAVERDGNDDMSHIAGGAAASDGGSLFAYRIPEGKGAWKTEPWIRSTVATGFKVHGQLNNMINPGAPGFVYTFHAQKKDIGTTKKPMIAVAGDCAESAYIFRPEHIAPADEADPEKDHATSYKLMLEIKCGATVGSIGVGYDEFDSTSASGYAKLYIPCYEKDRVLVFGLGSGEDDNVDEGW